VIRPDQDAEEDHGTGLMRSAESHWYLQQYGGDAEADLHRQP
jgi:hypothetical protein